jgi:adenylyltransferase/sulfurtransferase
VVGAGAIGSHLVPHLARMPLIGRLTVIDRDAYEPRNARNQDVTPRTAATATARKKAVAQANRARLLRPTLEVRAIADDVERLPLAELRADVVLCCVDSRRARQYLNQAAWRLGLPWIDAGLMADGLLARVTLYRPGSGLPCLECAWHDADYRALEQTYACAPEPAFPATGGPSGLAALAAALQAIECRKLLAGEATLEPGGEVVIDAAWHRHYVTRTRHNPNCRMPDHQPWRIDRLEVGRRVRLRDLFAAAQRRSPGSESPALRVAGQRFVTELSCPDCAAVTRPVRLAERLRPSDTRCPGCGTELAVSGFARRDRIDASALSRRELARPLSALGVRDRDVLSIGSGTDTIHLEVTAS